MGEKWLINTDPKYIISKAEKQKYWEETNKNYDTVWSVTEDKILLKKFIDEINQIDKVEKILIPGCGSKTLLQEQISKNVEGVKTIMCTDFAGVVNIASKKKR